MPKASRPPSRCTRTLGIPGDTLLTALADSPLLSAWTSAKLRRVLRNDYSAEFSLTNARKDVGLAIDALAANDATTLRCLADRWDGFVARGLGDDDVTVVARGEPSGA